VKQCTSLDERVIENQEQLGDKASVTLANGDRIFRG